MTGPDGAILSTAERIRDVAVRTADLQERIYGTRPDEKQLTHFEMQLMLRELLSSLRELTEIVSIIDSE